MGKLQPYALYSVPGSERPVFPVPVRGGYFLYDGVQGARLLPRFEVKGDGRVVAWYGNPVSWRVEDLVDTGQTYGR